MATGCDAFSVIFCRHEPHAVDAIRYSFAQSRMRRACNFHFADSTICLNYHRSHYLARNVLPGNFLWGA